MASKKRQSIDLLNPINPPTDLWTSIYNWVFNVGRYLLVGVEALLLGVFFARFTLDEINNDLTKSINDKVEVLSNDEFKSQEVRFRNIQNLLYDVKTLETKQKINSTTVSEIVSGVPASLSMQNFTFNSDKVSMQLKSANLQAIKDYEYSIRQNSKFSDINVTISKNGVSTQELTMTLSFNIVNNKK